jgi:transposase
VDRWLEKYGKLEYHKYSTIGRPMKDKDKQYIKELEAKLRVKEKHLEKQLKLKEAELLAYKQFIKIAERELNIKIQSRPK